MMARVDFVFVLFISLFCLCFSRMPSGYSDRYARHIVCPLASLSVHKNDTYVNQILNCFYNATVSSDLFMKIKSRLLVSNTCVNTMRHV
jgi:hypothetical protein